MKNTPVIGLALVAILQSYAFAQEAPANPRLDLFERAQRACMTGVLGSPDIAANLVQTTRTPVSHICECAALLAVSKMADADLALALPDARSRLMAEVGGYTSTCAQIQPD